MVVLALQLAWSYFISLNAIKYAVIGNQIVGFASLLRVSGSNSLSYEEQVYTSLETISLLLPMVANQMCISGLMPRHKNKITCCFFILLYLSLISRDLGLDYVY